MVGKNVGLGVGAGGEEEQASRATWFQGGPHFLKKILLARCLEKLFFMLFV